MKKIEVLHCHGSGVMPTLIGTISNSWCTHSAIRVKENSEIGIYEAQKHGIHRLTEQEWVEKYGYKYKVTEHIITNNQYDKMISKVGKTPYDFRSLFFSQPLYLLTSFFGNGYWLGSRGKSSEKEMYCSEYVGWVLGFDKWWTLSPKAIYKLCQDENNK